MPGKQFRSRAQSKLTAISHHAKFAARFKNDISRVTRPGYRAVTIFGVFRLDLVCAAPCMAGANQSANQAQTKAQIKFPMTSAHLLAVTFGGANHRANQTGCNPQLNHAKFASSPRV